MKTNIEAVCRNCFNWEPEMNPAMAKDSAGYCPVFEKQTDAKHGSQCTAFVNLHSERIGDTMNLTITFVSPK